MQAINITHREENVPYEHCEAVTIPKGTTTADFSIGAIDKIKEKTIIGLYIPMQSKDADYTRTYKGKPLVNRKATATGYLSLKSNIGEQILGSPIEHFGYDVDTHRAGSYKKIISPGNQGDYTHAFDLKQSKINIDTSKIENDEGEVLLLCFIYLDPTVCVTPKICP